MKSIFLKKQEETPKNKVLDFLITNSELDYSLKEISRYSGAGYSTVKLLMKKLLKDKWVIVTRRISKIKLYKLNVNNPAVKKFIDFYWAVIEEEIGERGVIKVRDNVISCSSGSIPISAKNI
ncbi:MAG: hypothetical protein ABII01_03335 [Candidatus Woesearchaeota archaeon]